MNGEVQISMALNNLCNLMTSAHLAAVPLSGVLWKTSISNLLKAAMEANDLSTDQLLQVILQACVNHPLVEMAPREPEHGPNMLQWLREAWEAKGWDIPPLLKCGDGKTGKVRNGRELVYKTYIDYGADITLLESRNGIVSFSRGGKDRTWVTAVSGPLLDQRKQRHWRKWQRQRRQAFNQQTVDHKQISIGTTGLTTWVGAAVLADFVVNTPEITKDRRVLELGSGMGLAAASLLKQKSNLPKSYLATDCHHHVLALLEHNINININQPTVESLESFRDEMCQRLDKEEVRPGVIVPWTSTIEEISRDPELSVSVRQVDWRSPPQLPPVDVIIGSDIVYCHDLIPPLVTLIKSLLNGDAFGENEKQNIKLNNKNRDKTISSQSSKENQPQCNGDTKTRGREAFIACTRRSRETLEVFSLELSKQGLEFEQFHQSFMNKEEAIFETNETYHPIKIYRISLPKQC